MLNLIPRHRFETLVKQHQTDRYVKHFNCWNQLTTLLCAQASGKLSLRDIQQAFQVQAARLYHPGLKSVKRSTLSDANTTRNYEIFGRDFLPSSGTLQGSNPWASVQV